MTDEELYLYVANDGDIYRQLTSPLYSKLASKKKSGVYSHTQAVAWFGDIVEVAARKYRKEFPGSPSFSTKIQRVTAEAMADYFEREYALGNIGNASKKTPAQLDKEISILSGSERKAMPASRRKR